LGEIFRASWEKLSHESTLNIPEKLSLNPWRNNGELKKPLILLLRNLGELEREVRF